METLTELLHSITKETITVEKNRKLNTVFAQYDHAEIIGTMAMMFSLSEILECFQSTDAIKCDSREIKTIGTYYVKMNNGGVPRILASLLCLWTEMGYKVVLYTDLPENEDDYSYPKTVKRIIVPNTYDPYTRVSFWEQSLLENQVDIMVDHNWMPSYLIWDVLLIKSLHIPFVLYVHGHFTALYYTYSEYNMLAHKVFALCDLVLSLADDIARFYKLCGCRSKLIYNPINPELLTDTKRAALDSHNIIWIGRVCSGKRPYDAIEIMDRVLREVPDAELTLVGDGTEHDMNALYRLCEQKKISEHVHFAGFQIVVAPYYQQAAVMLMTSEREGYPTVILESKAYGLPTVMYELSYLTLTKDKEGIVPVEMGDVEAAAEAIIELLKNEEKRFRLGQAAKQSFEVLKQADLKAEWKSILNSFQYDQEDIKANTTDSLMIQMLLEQLKTASERDHINSLDYKVGNMILRFPRMLYHFVQKCRNRLIAH